MKLQSMTGEAGKIVNQVVLFCLTILCMTIILMMRSLLEAV